MRRKINAVLLSLTLGLTAATCALPVSGAIAAEANTPGVTMYRLYNPNSGEHFYTKDATEQSNLVKAGWSDEGIGWIAPEKSNTPVYRLYNENAGDHHYTLDAKERDNLISVGWKDEGTGWYSDDDKTVPLYREYNPNAVTGTHNYTTDKAEHDGLVKAGWKDEGIGWYATENGKPKELMIGDIIILGTYEQDNDLTNGPEPIEWQYIGDRDGHKLLLSKYVLEGKAYQDGGGDITWENCTLRKWLNNDFYNTAFSVEDKKKIETAHNENPNSYELYEYLNTDSKTYGAEGGNTTEDKVFLLSWTEARDYLDGKRENAGVGTEKYSPKILIRPTAYAEAQDLGTAPDNYPPEMKGCCWWWLRSPGQAQNSAMAGGFHGFLTTANVDVDFGGVCPVILID